jgi:DNA-binding CsgD family transcriptional regulator
MTIRATRDSERQRVGGATREDTGAGPGGRQVAGAFAALVRAIGSDGFAERFLAVLHVLSGASLCSVFRICPTGGVELLFAAGRKAGWDFPLRASMDYERAYWRADAQLADLMRILGDAPAIVRRRASEIGDTAYRAACYDRADISERITILCPGDSALIINGYFGADGARPGVRDIRSLQDHAEMLIAAIGQHLRASARMDIPFDRAAMADALARLGHGLSPREAQVAAGMMLGETQERIAETLGVGRATIITYRRRAYQKLGVSCRRDLVALHRRLVIAAGRAD